MALVVKNPPTCAGRPKRHRFDPWIRKIPWRRAWQPTPVFLPGESHGQKSLAGYSPWGHKELDMTEATALKQSSVKTHLVGNVEYTIMWSADGDFYFFIYNSFAIFFCPIVLTRTSSAIRSGDVCVHAKSLQSCPTLCHFINCSPPGSSVHRILQARILEWVAISTPGDLPDPGIKPTPLTSLDLAGRFFTW